MLQNRAKILLVDDVPMNIQILYMALKDEFDVVFATDGADALAIAEREQPDLILLDVLMPDMDGYETCRRLKANLHTRSIPIIFVSALNDEVDELHGFNLGAVDYLSKPISPAITRVRVRNHIERKRLYDLLAKEARSDALTGLANRRKAEEWLDKEWRHCARNNMPLTLMMIDVDFFKLYNDHYGHGSGDDCLRMVAHALHQCAGRAGDLIARYGGEEFLCIAPETPFAAGFCMAEQMREAVFARQHLHAVSPYGFVTVSIGLATAIPDDSSNIENLLKAADTQLYAAKQAGRNKVL